MNTKNNTPETIYICSHNGQIVDKNYPNAVEYVRKDAVEKENHYMDDLSFISHA